eukprot:TRINITY_DN98426_c0_g1_i1.p1 TRINITY_DN98426_c0_g1~~TRINITY_DN98426_c0_g1_i1.p1  ORF type:complete len:466 (+),score=79.54 TRINITY_DN98426_c0_g1_i1:74-1399(+)
MADAGYSGYSHYVAGPSADAVVDRSAWSEVVDILLALQQHGLQVTAPEKLAHIFAERLGDELRAALHHFPAPHESLRAEFQVEAPMWRLSAAYPDLGGTNHCTLRVTLPISPRDRTRGLAFEVFAVGEMGRQASALLSQAAHAKLAELRRGEPAPSAVTCITGIAEWVENTELLELASSLCAPAPSIGKPVASIRAFVRFHHVLGLFKRGYMRLWAEDLGLGALLAVGQPAMLLAEGPADSMRSYIERVTKLVHWGPTPARLVGSTALGESDGTPLPLGLKEVMEVFPGAVIPNGTYNGRHSTNYAALAAALGKAGHTTAGKELMELSSSAFAHVDGRVVEAADGSGWIGYATPECELAQPQGLSKSAEVKRRYRVGPAPGGKQMNNCQMQSSRDLQAARGAGIVEGEREASESNCASDAPPTAPEAQVKDAPKRRWGRKT